MSARATWLVIEREVRESARRKGVWALVIVTFLGASALALAPNVIPGDDNDRVMIAGVDDIGLDAALRTVEDPQLEISTGFDRRDAADAIGARETDVAVIMGPNPSLLVEDEDSRLVGIVADVVADQVVTTRLAAAGIEVIRVREAFEGAYPLIEPIDVEREGREAAAFMITLVLYILTVVPTSQVASGVAVEKSNRVSEVLLAIVPPRSLLFQGHRRRLRRAGHAARRRDSGVDPPARRRRSARRARADDRRIGRVVRGRAGVVPHHRRGARCTRRPPGGSRRRGGAAHHDAGRRLHHRDLGR